MAVTDEAKIPLEGMVTDNHSINIDDKQYRYMLNGAIETFDGQSLLLQNDPSNVLAVNLPDGYQIIGKRLILEQDRVILAIVNPATGQSEFGEYHNCSFTDSSDSVNSACVDCQEDLTELTPLEQTIQTPYCTYRTIAAATCLNFNINNPVNIEYKITDCGLNIYFTDILNEQRFLYFDYADGYPNGDLSINNQFLTITGYTPDDCHSPIYSNDLDCNKILYYPNYNKPCIEFVELTSGGQLVSGTYQALIAYSDQNGIPLSEYTPGSQPIPVSTKHITTETNYKTDKAVVFDVNNLAQDVYSYYNFVVAETIDNFTTFKLVGTFSTSISRITYTGNDLYQNLTANDVLFSRPFYKSAKSITSANGYLFLSGLTEFSKINLQPIASKIKFKWFSAAIKEDTYTNPRNTFYLKSYMRDEVYPLALLFEADNGEALTTIHIPGPSAQYFLDHYNIDVNQIVNNKDIINDTSCDPDLRNKAWQVYNLSQLTEQPHNFTDDCKQVTEWESGDFAYWQSTDIYPNIPEVWGDLCGQPIRHHKFPDNSVSHIHDGKDGAKPFTDNNIVFPIGVKLDQQSLLDALSYALTNNIITLDQFSRIKSYRIVRGNRVGHKSIVAKGLIYDVWDYNKNNKHYYYPNYPYNDLRQDKFIGKSINTYETPDSSSAAYWNTLNRSGRYTFHSPDIHFTNPSLSSLSELKLETLEYGKAEGFFNEAKLQAKYKFLSTASYVLSLASGVAAALSATEARECTTYSVRSDTLATSTVSGTSPYGNVSGTGGTVSTLPASAPWSGAGTTDESYNLTEFIQPYDKTTGLSVTSIPIPVETKTKTTCTGSTWQEMNKPGILSILTGAFGLGKSIQGIIYQISLGLFEMKKVLDLIDALIPNKNLALQYNSIGKYNNYKAIPNFTGEKKRKVERAVYLNDEYQTITEDITAASQSFSTINFNNWHRETGVYLKIQYANLNELLPDPQIQDNSRFLLSEKGSYGDTDVNYISDISSYYASLKNYVPDQYGKISSVNYLDTNCSYLLTDANPFAFGGDTFINRFAIKRKQSFFTQTAFELNNQADIRYQDYGNVGFPNYYFNTAGSLMENIASLTNVLDILLPSNIPTLFGVPRNRLDNDTHATLFYQKGHIYLYSYGIPYFFVESDVNTDLRHGENSTDRNYYPNTTDISTWFQEYIVPPKADNFYAYNNTFSKQNHESIIVTNKENFIPQLCKTSFPSRIIYSEPDTTISNDFDNWRIFKANNYFDFPLSNGQLISADGIENEKILVRFENATAIFNAYTTLATDQNTIQVGNGGIFTTKPQEFQKTDLGYIGTQHKAILHTDFGHIWADAKRGQIFIFSGTQLEEISKNGMKNWFKENLPFQIQKDFKNVSDYDLDNNYKGLGLHMSFDKKFSRFFITKLDYKATDALVKYDDTTHQFFYRDDSNTRINIELSNFQFFCNKSWTLSYNFITKSWASFHSFTPNVYIDWIDYFQSSQANSIWSHNLTNKSFQVYYGILQPFTIDFQTKPTANSYLNNIEFGLETVRYHGIYDKFYNDIVCFNKAIIYNNKQCSGELNLVVSNPDDMSAIGMYPSIVGNGTQIEVTNRQDMWSFNDFSDVAASNFNNSSFFINNCANSNKSLNIKSLNYFKGDLNKSPFRSEFYNLRLTNDKYSNYHFIMKTQTTRQNQSLG